MRAKHRLELIASVVPPAIVAIVLILMSGISALGAETEVVLYKEYKVSCAILELGQSIQRDFSPSSTNANLQTYRPPAGTQVLTIRLMFDRDEKPGKNYKEIKFKRAASWMFGAIKWTGHLDVLPVLIDQKGRKVKPAEISGTYPTYQPQEIQFNGDRRQGAIAFYFIVDLAIDPQKVRVTFMDKEIPVTLDLERKMPWPRKS